MYRIIYISTANKEMSDEDIQNILVVSKENNKRKDITGALLYRSGFFLQYLEGDKDKLYALYEIISLDRRHKDVTTIASYEDNDDSRLYPSWNMEKIPLSIDAEEVVDMATKFIHDSFDDKFDKNNVTKLITDFLVAESKKT